MESIWHFFYTHAASIGALVIVIVTIFEFLFFRKTAGHHDGYVEIHRRQRDKTAF